jgi:DNA replication ATP-dependent helicase Dna2
LQLTYIAPLELKSGARSHVSIEHKSQVTLYMMLMSDHYNVDIQYGMVLYLQNGSLMGFTLNRDELRGIIIRRNDLARWMSQNRLPSELADERICSRCEHLAACAAFNAVEKQNSPAPAMENVDLNVQHIVQQRTEQLSASFISYFEHWDMLLNLEAGDTTLLKTEIWSLSSTQRQQLGR